MSDELQDPDDGLEPNLNPFDQLKAILDHPDASMDQKLERIVETLNHLDAQLLEAVSKFSADEIEEAFTAFVALRESDENVQFESFLIAVACAAELKRRANRVGVSVLEYARLTRLRRELDNA